MLLINRRPRGALHGRVLSNFQNVGKWILKNMTENTRPRRI